LAAAAGAAHTSPITTSATHARSPFMGRS
jgi:hypothetical protein